MVLHHLIFGFVSCKDNVIMVNHKTIPSIFSPNRSGESEPMYPAAHRLGYRFVSGMAGCDKASRQTRCRQAYETGRKVSWTVSHVCLNGLMTDWDECHNCCWMVSFYAMSHCRETPWDACSIRFCLSLERPAGSILWRLLFLTCPFAFRKGKFYLLFFPLSQRKRAGFAGDVFTLFLVVFARCCRKGYNVVSL